jgi:hypothetical protein
VGERFERATEFVHALVCELAGLLDLVGDAPDLGLKGTAVGCQVDQHAALVSRIAGARHEAGALPPQLDGEKRWRL